MSEFVTVKDGFSLAALAAAAGRPASEIAAVAGVSERTIRRWNRRPAFVALVSRLRDQLLDNTMGRLLATNGQAVEALAGLLKSQNESIVLGSAARLLDMTLRARKQLDSDKELEQLKESWEALKREHPNLFDGGADSSARTTNRCSN